MTAANPLVAEAPKADGGLFTKGTGQEGWATGIAVASDAVDAYNGIKDGNWVDAGLGIASFAMDAVSAAIDPFGTLMQSAASFLMEHLQPLKQALDWLAGNPPVIQSYGATWGNVAKEIGKVAEEFAAEVQRGTADWKGPAADAYRAAATAHGSALSGAASLADGIGTVVTIMGAVVDFVRSFVRDLIAELVGKLISWVLEEVFSLGFGTPVVVAQAMTAISAYAAKIATKIKSLISTIKKVSPKIGKLIEMFEKLLKVFSKFKKFKDEKIDAVTRKVKGAVDDASGGKFKLLENHGKGGHEPQVGFIQHKNKGEHDPAGHTPGGHDPTTPTGHDPTGHGPTGHDPAGHDPTGHGPTGHDPAGHDPTGHGPTGHNPTGHDPAGHDPTVPTGHDPAGHDPAGHDPAGHDPTGHDPAGHDPAGHDPAGHDPTGHDPAGHDPTGHDPTVPTGHDPAGHDPAGHDGSSHPAGGSGEATVAGSHTGSGEPTQTPNVHDTPTSHAEPTHSPSADGSTPSGASSYAATSHPDGGSPSTHHGSADGTASSSPGGHPSESPGSGHGSGGVGSPDASPPHVSDTHTGSTMAQEVRTPTVGSVPDTAPTHGDHAPNTSRDVGPAGGPQQGQPAMGGGTPGVPGGQHAGASGGGGGGAGGRSGGRGGWTGTPGSPAGSVPAPHDHPPASSRHGERPSSTPGSSSPFSGSGKSPSSPGGRTPHADRPSDVRPSGTHPGEPRPSGPHPGSPHASGPNAGPHPGSPHAGGPNAGRHPGSPDVPGPRTAGAHPGEPHPNGAYPRGPQPVEAHPGGPHPAGPHPGERPPGGPHPAGPGTGSHPGGTHPGGTQPGGPAHSGPTRHPGSSEPHRPGGPQHHEPQHGPGATGHEPSAGHPADHTPQHHDDQHHQNDSPHQHDGSQHHEPDHGPVNPEHVVHSQSEATPAGRSYHSDDPQMQHLAHQVPPDPHRYTVDAHAGPNGIHINGRTYNADEFAQIMRHDPHWDGKSPIRLIGCDSGSLPDGFAHDLSRKLGVPVTAPTHPAWTDGHGRVFSTSYTHGPNGTVHPKWPPDGEWKTFHPDGSSHPAGHNGFPPGHEPSTHHDGTHHDGTHHPEEPPKDARARGEGGEHHEHGDGAHPHEPEKVAVGKDHDLSPPKSRAFGRDEHGNPVTLEPNKSYDVTDKAGRNRGTFVTDEHGHIKEVHTTSGQKGDWRPDAREPLPNVDYHITGRHGSEYHFHTDSEGRTVSAEGDLMHTGSDDARRSPDQGPVGHEGRDEYKKYNEQVIEDFKASHGREPEPHEVVLFNEEDWNGGHLFGTEFDGPGEYINMVPMLATLNQSQAGRDFTENYRALEEHWGSLLNSDPPHKVAAQINMTYDPATKAPKYILVRHSVDGVPQDPLKYRNIPPRRP